MHPLAQSAGLTPCQLQEKAAGHFLDAMRTSRHYPLDNLNWERAAREESRTRASDLLAALGIDSHRQPPAPAPEATPPAKAKDCPWWEQGSAPSLADAREAARQLGGEAATVVRRFLDGLPAADPPSQPAPPVDPPAEQHLRRQPLGLRPLEFAVHDRRTELLAAIERYAQAGTAVPEVWKRELAVVHWALDLLRQPRLLRELVS